MILISALNITNFLVTSINSMLSNLLSSINENIYDLLDELIFISNPVTLFLKTAIGHEAIRGITLLCNSLIYGFIIYYAASFLLSHITYAQVERPSQFVFKLILCTIALNFSEIICSSIISLFSIVSNIIIQIGSEALNYEISFSLFFKKILPNSYLSTNAFNLFSFYGIINTTISFGFFNLAISYAVRYFLLIILVVISPLAILSLASTKTSYFFKTWFRNFIALLFLQILVALILLICYVINEHSISGLPSHILYLGMVYTLFKANSFVRDLIGGFSTEIDLNIPSLSSIIKGGNIK